MSFESNYGDSEFYSRIVPAGLGATATGQWVRSSACANQACINAANLPTPIGPMVGVAPSAGFEGGVLYFRKGDWNAFVGAVRSDSLQPKGH